MLLTLSNKLNVTWPSFTIPVPDVRFTVAVTAMFRLEELKVAGFGKAVTDVVVGVSVLTFSLTLVPFPDPGAPAPVVSALKWKVRAVPAGRLPEFWIDTIQDWPCVALAAKERVSGEAAIVNPFVLPCGFNCAVKAGPGPGGVIVWVNEAAGLEVVPTLRVTVRGE